MAPERRAAGRLSREVPGGVTGRQEGIGPRIPDRGIHAIEYPDDVICARLHHPLEPASAFRGLDLLGVGRTHGRDPVGEEDSP